MPSHPAYPTAREMRHASITDDLIAGELVEIEQMRAVIQTAIEGLSALRLRFWSPPGYDMPDVIGLLRGDFLPPPADVAAAQMRPVVLDYVAEAAAAEQEAA